ncbi:MAG: hypothetical protein DRK00_03355 [Thermoprotei archaeon]|nr:MAG: hypothetical protein DRK00_03355 [Thermoprotei archaeon]HDD33833.1 HAD family hydrolase [Thermofilaceae archaeon]
MIKAVSFDLDGTLVTKDYIDYFWLELLPSLYSKAHGIGLDRGKREVLMMYDEVGEEDLRWYLPRYWLRKLGLGVELEDLLEDLKRLVRPYDDALRIVKLLRGSYRLVILTNAAWEFVRVVLESIPLFGESFDLALSCVTHFALTRKTAGFYRAALKVLGLRPEELLHVGDDPHYDKEVPKSLGIRALYLSREGGGDISRLTELVNYLRLQKL